MGTVSHLAPPAIVREAQADVYHPEAEELKLYNWAVTYKAFGPAARKAIENFILRKQGATLDTLTGTERNSLRMKAVELGVSLMR